MKRILCLFVGFILTVNMSGCSKSVNAQVTATTLPVYDFTMQLCEGTGITVSRLITQNVSCLHDYTLQVGQMRTIESADVVIMSGAGLEDFLPDAFTGAANLIDASSGISLLETCHEHHSESSHGHDHEYDAHIWLSPANASIMAKNICEGLCSQYPAHADTFRTNLETLLCDLNVLQAYGEAQLKGLSCTNMVTFHDGFSYLADAFDLHIVKAIEEESGSEASAQELIEIIRMIDAQDIPAIFKEVNSATAAAEVIATQADVDVYSLDMAMAGESYFSAMYHNIDTIREALQ